MKVRVKWMEETDGNEEKKGGEKVKWSEIQPHCLFLGFEQEVKNEEVMYVS